MIGFASCSKWKANRSNTPAIDHGIAQSTVHDLFLQAYFNSVLVEGKAFDLDKCRDFSKNKADYPLIISLDFGAENCEGTYTINRRGALEITINKAFNESGAVINISPKGYFVNDYEVVGNLRITNSGLSENQKPSYTLSAADLKFSSNESTSFTWSPERVYELIEGQSDPDFVWNDVFSVSGSSSGVDRDGTVFLTEIDEALHYPLVCRWPSGGKESLDVENADKREIAYGNGLDCDNKAEIKFGKKSKTLNLR